MELIETRTLTTTSTSILFSNIPNRFTDLRLVMSLRSTNNDHIDASAIKINGSTSISVRSLYGAGATNIPYGTGTVLIGYGYTGVTAATFASSNTFSSTEVYLANYATSSPKAYFSEAFISSDGSNGGPYPGYVELRLSAGLWNNSAPITSLEVYSPNGNSWVAQSSASLYGITRGSDGITQVS